MGKIKNNITRILFFTACGAAVVFNNLGCKKQEYIKASGVMPEKRIGELFGSNNSINRPKLIKLYKDTVYILDIPITIEAGEQLLIEEGTLIKAGVRNIANPESNNPSEGSLTIKKGGVMLANGTRSEPIVFTSNTTAGAQRINWGGITIEGKSIDNDIASGIVDTADFSGSLRYCRIEFAPLTLRGVGSRTFIENLMVSYTDRNGLNAYNIFGGTFNAKNLIAYACSGPADFYFTNGYSGKMQHILSYRHPFFGKTGNIPFNSVAGVVIENNPFNAVNARPFTLPVISNLTVIGPNAQKGSTVAYSDTNIRAAALVTTGSACFNIRNSVFLGYPESCWILDDNFTTEAILVYINVVSYSIFQANDTSRAFYLKPGTYPPQNSSDFKRFILTRVPNNRLLNNADNFLFNAIFNYSAPGLLPKENSIVLNGANFTDTFGDRSFFEKVNHIGAFGTTDWTLNWTNFTPLKTNYNFPE